jgi:mRNA-degrading endonuclease RelE of RelBE toxin-antitoxin system
MAHWNATFSVQAGKDLKRLDKNSRRQIIDKIGWFENHIGEVHPIQLNGDLGEIFKLRSGDFRILYGINWKKYLIEILKIGRRDKIYKT